MGDDDIDMVILHIDMRYLVTLVGGHTAAGTAIRSSARRAPHCSAKYSRSVSASVK
jgi:hypothetical protein